MENVVRPSAEMYLLLDFRKQLNERISLQLKRLSFLPALLCWQTKIYSDLQCAPKLLASAQKTTCLSWNSWRAVQC